MTKITDAVQIGDAAVDAAGYLQANARTARTGVQQYLGRELGRPDLDVVNVYRDEADVFSKRSLDTFSRLPITNDHPGVDVDATNWKDLAVGTTGDDVLRDGEYLKIGLKITDASAVKAVKDGKRELSVGYSAEIEWQDGVAPDGTPYQARQKNIVANHVAIVQKGRAGAKARIGDAWGASPIQDFQPGASPKTVEEGRMTDSLKTVVLGDKAVQVAVTDVAAIEQYKATMNQALADADAAKKKVEEEKDEEIGKLKADLKKAEDAAKIDVDALVASRADLLGKVKALDAAIDPKGKTDAELRKAAVAARMGDEAVKDASDAEIAGMFKALTRDAKPVNPVAGVIADGARVTTNDAWADAVASSGVKMKKEG
ncbi:DUF2213 domain-containing protein [Achromobacter sp. GG226]|uniref:DUF2213 domain-containing protein n=1 Tax=Verticiella alkaliphila TaxID=2779529 RepID=UPI001C0B188C|nr:DUF2213 domain-containing protein [Verticiella sp. GG226]MBU4609144.1 DUF2213 domain-containing protein [Verticiella sp. GG226]